MKKLFIFLTLFIATAANAQQQKKPTTAKKKTTSKTATKKPAPLNDNSLITGEINNDLMQVELGGYAERFAAEQRVKDLGAAMVRDHRRTKIELKSIAADKNMAVSDAMDAWHKAKADAMEKKKGSDFDISYVDMMISEHTKDLDDFKRAQLMAQDKKLKDLITHEITLARTHLDSAKSVQTFLKGK